MSAIQFCGRKLLLCNTYKIINKNGVFLQQTRNRHQFIYKVSSPLSKVILKRADILPKSHGLISYRLASSSTDIVINESTLPPIPSTEPPVPPVLDFVSTGLGEPSFKSLGLGSWWPSGIVQQVLEYLHVNLELEWWQAIIAVTLVVRLAIFPVTLQSKIRSINFSNHMPNLRRIQQEMKEASQSGDYYLAAVKAEEMNKFMQDKDWSVMGTVKPMLIQGGVFASMFFALRGMANLPVESLKTGGALWFTDLTVPDPYYALPIIVSVTQSIMLEVGAETPPAHTTESKARWFMRCIPLVILFFSIKFSSCVALYWSVSNFFVLMIVNLYKVPYIKRALKIPDIIKPDYSKAKKSTKGFVQDFKDGLKQAKLASQIADREKMNSIAFSKAGSGPIPRTFKTNPLEQKKKTS